MALAREKARLGALRVGQVEYCEQSETNQATLYRKWKAEADGLVDAIRSKEMSNPERVGGRWDPALSAMEAHCPRIPRRVEWIEGSG
jgi:hypothetical protein